MGTETEYHTLWSGGPRFRQSREGFPLSTDSVLLAAFAAGIRARRILDLGCGAGVLTVLLCFSHPGATLAGIELREAAAELCRENLRVNGFDASGIQTGDLRAYRSFYAAGAWDLVISNPPYFPLKSGYSSPDAVRAEARDERSCTLEELCAAAAWLCRWGGVFALVHRPERLSELFCAMTAKGIEPKRLRLVQHRANAAPSLALVEGRRGGRPGLKVEPPLILQTDDGADSPECREIYHREG